MRSKGFSLIELMIVVAIIGILAVIAVPSYQKYTQRARFAEIISTTESFKTAISLALQEGVSIAEIANGAHGVPAEPKGTKHLASLKVENGIITAVGTAMLSNVTYILKPNSDGSTWAVSGTCLKAALCDA